MQFPVLTLAVAASLAASVTGCDHVVPVLHDASASTNQSTPDQTHVCEVRQWQQDVSSAECKTGQKVVFLPSSFGNEQLPILFAAVNCDLRYSTALTNGGVTCIYVGPLAPTTKADASPPKSQLTHVATQA
jgi:hypothetical protein